MKKLILDFKRTLIDTSTQDDASMRGWGSPGKSSSEVEGIKLDPDNPEFQYALQFALESNRNLYLTGKAGSGKTTFLKYLRQITRKKMVVLAPTGVAAMNAGGQTIHSFFHIAPSLYVPDDKRLRTRTPENDPDGVTVYDNFVYNKEKRTIIRNLELLVIDEVSMVRADILDVVDTLLRVYRKSKLPFGGVQVILIGDAFQLPPVVKGEEKDLLMKYYESEFFFSARVIQMNKPLYIELKKIYRQNEQDFIDLLNRVRVNQMLPGDFRALDARVNPNFMPVEEDNYITLATKNDRVAEINGKKLEKLSMPLKTYVAEVTGDFPEGIRPTETELQLKVGAQVMFLKNDPDKRYYNGKIGVVVETGDNDVKVETEVGQGLRKVIVVNEATWTNVVYHWDEENKCIVEEVIGSFKQFPLRLAWAITVHKSQGMTFEKVLADIGDSFASGQVYVALSRCTSMNGLVLMTRISPWVVKTDKRVLEFARNETPETLLTEQLSSSKADFYYDAARKAFRRRHIKDMLDNFYTALRYRNDISTDTFRRFVTVWLQRLFDLESYGKSLEKTIAERDESIRKYTKQVDSLKEKIRRKEAELAFKSKEIRLSNSRVIYLEEMKKNLEDDLEKAKKTNQTDTKTISELKHDIETRDNLMKEKQKEIQELSTELERVRGIKWYQKLFGKN